jgi:spore coat polysaccharide biosynthesis protein SpsF
MEGTAIVLQARTGSRRLPGKVLARLRGRTLLEHAILRLRTGGLRVIVATTERSADDAIVHEAQRMGIDVFRGAEDDVLSRFLGAAATFGLTTIVRATADNPLVDPEAPARALEVWRNVPADHVVERGLPIGAAVEVVRVSALERSATLIQDPYDREHVTSFIRRDARFRALRAMAPGDRRRPGLRLTVDTAEDLAFVRAILDSPELTDELPRLPDVIRVADALLVGSIGVQRTQRGA